MQIDKGRHLGKVLRLFNSRTPSFFFFLILFIYSFICGCAWSFLLHGLFPSCGECWLLIAVASLVAEHRLTGHEAPVAAARGLSRCGSLVYSTGAEVVANWPSCSAACGILPDQGSNPHPLHWQADSQTLSHQGSSRDWAFKIILLQINSCNKLFSCSGYDCIMSKHLVKISVTLVLVPLIVTESKCSCDWWIFSLFI